MIFVTLLGLVTAGWCSAIGDPPCPDVTPMKNFDLSLLGTGRWYEISRYPFKGEEALNCLTYDAHMEGDKFVGKTVSVPGRKEYITAAESQYHPDANGSGLLKLTLFTTDNKEVTTIPKLYVLEMNPEKYAISYTCGYDEEKKVRQEIAWCLSRQKTITEEEKEELKNVMRATKYIDPEKLLWIDNSSCSNKV